MLLCCTGMVYRLSLHQFCAADSLTSGVLPAVNHIFDFLNDLDPGLFTPSIESDITTAETLVSGIESLLGAPVAAPFTGRKLMGSA